MNQTWETIIALIIEEFHDGAIFIPREMDNPFKGRHVGLGIRELDNGYEIFVEEVIVKEENDEQDS